MISLLGRLQTLTARRSFSAGAHQQQQQQHVSWLKAYGTPLASFVLYSSIAYMGLQVLRLRMDLYAQAAIAEQENATIRAYIKNLEDQLAAAKAANAQAAAPKRRSWWSWW